MVLVVVSGIRAGSRRAGYEEMEITVAPDIIDGAAKAIANLAQDFPLWALVSDAIVSPGRCLRQWLELNQNISILPGIFIFR
ncbi:MAG: hypothetical protein CM1200mP41_39670 [Gammaproteobacteria bacterium]|nr:MAG: hypothetical protein CM1200mP41_39670 [Gammaproteobacteria bacterium]